MKTETLIKKIEDTPLYLAEIPMEAHPKLPNFNRFIRITGLETVTENEYMKIAYQQVLTDKETGEESKLKLPNPDWIILKDTWSYLRDSKGQILKEANDEGEEVAVKVSSYKYMLWMLREHKAGLIDLLEMYMVDFVRMNREELDAI